MHLHAWFSGDVVALRCLRVARGAVLCGRAGASHRRRASAPAFESRDSAPASDAPGLHAGVGHLPMHAVVALVALRCLQPARRGVLCVCAGASHRCRALAPAF